MNKRYSFHSVDCTIIFDVSSDILLLFAILDEIMDYLMKIQRWTLTMKSDNMQITRFENDGTRND